MVHPRYSFGSPVIVDHHIPTSVLYSNYKAESNDVATVALNYEIPIKSVHCAVAFHKELLSRNA